MSCTIWATCVGCRLLMLPLEWKHRQRSKLIVDQCCFISVQFELTEVWLTWTYIVLFMRSLYFLNSVYSNVRLLLSVKPVLQNCLSFAWTEILRSCQVTHFCLHLQQRSVRASVISVTSALHNVEILTSGHVHVMQEYVGKLSTTSEKTVSVSWWTDPSLVKAQNLALGKTLLFSSGRCMMPSSQQSKVIQISVGEPTKLAGLTWTKPM